MNQSQLNALVADDDPIAQGIVADQLRRLGAHSVRCVGSGKAAIETLQQDADINLLVTDLRMPDTDGIALLRQLEEFRLRLCVIIMSALGDKILRAAATIGIGHDLRIIGVAVKPVRFDQLRRLLESGAEGTIAPPASDSWSDVVPSDIRNALADGQYAIQVQPVIDALSLQLVSVEVLSRWTHPVLRHCAPGDVILAAEAHGLIMEVTRQALQGVGDNWPKWRSHGLCPKIALNISAHTLADLSFPDWVTAELDAYSIRPKDVIFELTETAMPADAPISLEVACRLGLYGFKLAIDDFGTGYANLTQLKDAPIQQLKIDKSFVEHIETSSDSRTIVESSIQLAHELGLTTVGEGVERPSQVELLRTLGCDHLQGYLFARPMPPAALADWARSFDPEALGLAPERPEP